MCSTCRKRRGVAKSPIRQRISDAVRAKLEAVLRAAEPAAPADPSQESPWRWRAHRRRARQMASPAESPKRMSLARNTAVIGGLTLVSRLFGFARDLLLAAALGAGPSRGRVLRGAAVSQICSAVCSPKARSARRSCRFIQRRWPRRARKRRISLAGEALSVLLAVTAILSASPLLAMPWINRVLFAGYVDDPETFQSRDHPDADHHAVPGLHDRAATLFSGVLNARGKFFVAAAAPIAAEPCQLARWRLAVSR